jgi:hypothetical protein
VGDISVFITRASANSDALYITSLIQESERTGNYAIKLVSK